MSEYAQKVLWGEGMLLTPQHLQQTERYFEDLVHRRVRAVQALDWGLQHLRLDADALAAGELSLVEGAGVFPDGVHFSFPSRDAAPLPRKVAQHFPPNSPSLGVLLAMPRARPGELQVRTDPGSEVLTPYEGSTASVRDEAGGEERQIKVARKRLRILFTSEPREAHSCLPVAVLRRTAAGGVELEEQFIPTSVYASASPRLVGMLRRLLEVLVKKVEDLGRMRRHRADGMVDLSAAESANFWFLYTVNSSLPVLRSLYQQPRVHPFTVYSELSRLAGALFTFSGEGSAADIPPYNPEDLTSTFLPLEAQLLRLVGTALPSRCVPIPLERARDLVQAARIHDERLLTGARFFLGVAAEIAPERLVAEFPHKAKVSSLDLVDGLIVRALPGLPLGYMETPPPEVPARGGRVYFQMGQSGDHWEAIRRSGSLAIYVPAEFGAVKLELMAVKE